MSTDLTAKRSKKPMNQERRIKEMMNREPKKPRGEPIPQGARHKDKRDEKRQDTKRKMKEYTSAERDLLVLARELIAGQVKIDGHNFSSADMKKAILKVLSGLNINIGIDSLEIEIGEKMPTRNFSVNDFSYELYNLDDLSSFEDVVLELLEDKFSTNDAMDKLGDKGLMREIGRLVPKQIVLHSVPLEKGNEREYKVIFDGDFNTYDIDDIIRGETVDLELTIDVNPDGDDITLEAENLDDVLSFIPGAAANG